LDCFIEARRGFVSETGRASVSLEWRIDPRLNEAFP
jgi:hypothetical protein